MSIDIFKENWETALEMQFQKPNRCLKKAYICSPLCAKTDMEMIRNMRAARAYMFYAMKQMNVLARAPHAYLPALLCEKLPAERAMALEFGLRLLENSEVLFVCGDRISNGMKGEIGKAAVLNMDITVFDESLYPAVRKLVTQHGGNKAKVTLDEKNAFLSLPPEIIDC